MSERHVIKIGGSLLGTPGALQRVAAWIDRQRRPGEKQLLIAGGGPPVEGLRAVDRANPLPAEASHWAAIRLMDENTRLLPAWIPGVTLAGSPAELLAEAANCGALLVEKWLRLAEPSLPGERLAVGWQTTSDAIAARLAACLGARLTILKHGDAVVYDDLEVAARAGVIDLETPRVATGCPLVQLVALS